MARTLLSIIRMSQALARLRLQHIVTSDDFKESLRLLNMSKASLVRVSGVDAQSKYIEDVFEKICGLLVVQFQLRKDQTSMRNIYLTNNQIFEKLSSSYSNVMITDTLKHYKALEIPDIFIDGTLNVIA